MNDDVVMAGGYLPVGLWLGPTTCLVYTADTPEPQVVADLVDRLKAEGFEEIAVADDLRAAVLGVTMARVQDIGGAWAVWAPDEPTARAAITAAVTAEL